MREQQILNPETFNRLLGWLDADREAAGEKYERIRSKLIKIFRHRGCSRSEDLADETIDRVSRKVAEIADGYKGDPATYFYGVANKVFLEYLKREAKVRTMPVLPASAEEQAQRLDCLEHCLDKLNAEQRRLILDYYQQEKSAKIDHRRDLLAASGLPVNTFRMRIHRIKLTLQSCLKECLKSAEA